MNYKELTESVIALTKETGDAIMELRRNISANDIEAKGKNNFVTRFDKLSEEKLVAGLKKMIPSSGFIAEEGTSTEVGEVYNWIIDPIDGTTNFMHGAPPFCISIALKEKDELVIGVIYELFSKECFYSWKGADVYLNGEVVKASSAKTVADSLVATGFPYTDFGRMAKFQNTLSYFMENSHGLRRLGSAAIDLAYVAVGRYDGFYEYGLHPWDVAAGAFLVQQNGGKVTDYKGGDNFIFGKEIIAGNKYNADELVKVIGELMQDD